MTQKLLILVFAVQIILPAQVASLKVAENRGPCGPTNPAGCSNTGPWGAASFTATNVSLDYLVSLAYAIPNNQFSGEEHLGDNRYDISIKPESGAMTYERTLPMLRALLEERFKLVVHRETKQVSGYALVIAKGGPKLKESAQDAKPRGVINFGRLFNSQTTVDGIAALLSRPLSRPVVNKTGLSGNYVLDLKFTVEGVEPSPTAPSIFTAVQEQLGLKLESQKVPVEILVIDHCEHIPTEN